MYVDGVLAFILDNTMQGNFQIFDLKWSYSLQFLKIWLYFGKMSMFVDGVLGFILDNTMQGNSQILDLKWSYSLKFLRILLPFWKNSVHVCGWSAWLYTGPYYTR